MIAVLLTAAALLAWPEGGPRIGRRLGKARGRATVGREFSAVLGALPMAAVSGLAGAAAGALVSTGLVATLAGTCSAVAGRAWSAGRRRLRDEADVAGLADGLAAFGAELRAGRPPEDAARHAAAASGRPRCARALIRAVGPAGSGPAPPLPGGPFSEAVGRISVAAGLSGRTGCSLATVIGAVEDDLRARHGHARELRSLTAGPRASVALLAGLPVLGLAMGSGVGADPWHVLTATGPGKLLLVLGVGLELTGIAWSARLTARALR
ncbi:MAG: tight adherence protein [Blastococcus sp.]|nr:tight adherence protein [Blastococcus sp.]